MSRVEEVREGTKNAQRGGAVRVSGERGHPRGLNDSLTRKSHCSPCDEGSTLRDTPPLLVPDVTVHESVSRPMHEGERLVSKIKGVWYRKGGHFIPILIPILG